MLMTTVTLISNTDAHLTRLQAADYLAHVLPIKIARQWLAYLNENARLKHRSKIDYIKKGTCSFYSYAALNNFIEQENQRIFRQYQHLIQRHSPVVAPQQAFCAVSHHQAHTNDYIRFEVDGQNKVVFELPLEQVKTLIQKLKGLHPVLA